MEGATSLLPFVGTGALILRPRDIPVISRAIGRAVGSTVRSLRLAKNAEEEVVAENAKSANEPNSELSVVRRGLRDSLSKFHLVTAAVQKDMADVPLSPRMWIQRGVRSLDQAHQRERKHKREQSDSNAARSRAEPAKHWRDFQVPVSRKSVHGVARTNSSSGVDFIARAKEEASLAAQQKRVFAGPFPRTSQSAEEKT
ncbi:hypothetical protein FGB62_362g01 [Gracilaria domingensis]|nr:hypothetical protein FGB62_362g01 [Gracilaria domingensis]